MAATYQWAPLRDARCTRLVTLLPGKRDSPIEIELTKVSLDDDLTYEAVSYTWASAENPQTIYIDKEPTTIRKNLYDFFVQLRAKLVGQQTRVLWIDALSISQDQLVEKGQQVAMVGDIFSQAERVLVWLGEHADGSELVFGDDVGQHSYNPNHHRGVVGKTKLHYRTSKHSWAPKAFELCDSVCCERLSEQAEKSRGKAWAHLLLRAYWSRLWIVQEVAQAKSIVVHCGDRSRDWNTLVSHNMSDVRYKVKHSYFDDVPTMTHYRSYLVEMTGRSDTYHLNELLDSSLGPLDDFLNDHRPGPVDSLSYNIVENMHRFCPQRKCEDRRDKVYALLSISSISGLLESDYTLAMPELFLRIYLLHYSDDILHLPHSEKRHFRRKQLLGAEWSENSKAVGRLFRAMGLSSPEVCTVIDMLFTHHIRFRYPPGGSDAYYAAPVLVAAQFLMQGGLERFEFPGYEEDWKRAYNEVMRWVQHSGPRAAAAEMARRLRAVEGR